ncbi:hypothetical protein [Spiroplasma sp. BIUS-1]|uniref:hypothetical protein n=1 Tax=Spiroplasma sp. BIUS-1 TaxID=216964 RepID=UPI0013A6B6D0|nr:hypothetical protein [Spiroplasma sp. BIUS-1]
MSLSSKIILKEKGYDMKVFIKALYFVLPISIIWSNPVISEIVNFRDVKEIIRDFDREVSVIKVLSFGEYRQGQIIGKISEYLSNKNQLKEKELFINNQYYEQENFFIGGNIFFIKKAENYNKYKLNLNSLNWLKQNDSI